MILDVSIPLSPRTPAWPGDGGMVHEVLASLDQGAAANVSALRCPAHLGTHIDAPRHFLAEGATVEQLDLADFVGPARVVELADLEHVSAEALTDVLGQPPWPQRLLLRTRNSAPGGALDSDAFDAGFCALTLDAARAVASAGVRLIGIDYLSVAPFRGGQGVHEALLGAGLAVLEGLDLRKVEPGDYTLIALPLRLEGFDGSPVRAVLTTP